MSRDDGHSDGSVMELAIWQRPDATPERSHGLKQRLQFGRGGQSIVRYDNETGKGDHRHVRGREMTYRFVSVERLVRDEALERFEAVWRRDERGLEQPADVRLTFEDLPTLLRNLTPARWTLLEGLKRDGPCSINELTRLRIVCNRGRTPRVFVATSRVGRVDVERRSAGGTWRGDLGQDAKMPEDPGRLRLPPR